MDHGVKMYKYIQRKQELFCHEASFKETALHIKLS